MATITIDNRIRVDASELEPEEVEALCEAFEHKNPEFFKREKLGFSTRGIGRTIRMWERKDSMLEFPRGGLPRVSLVLENLGVDRHFVDKRTEGVTLTKRIPNHRVKLWSHQARLVRAAIEKQNCILKAPTGSGKTTVAFAIAAELKLTTLIVVSTRALFDQWIRRAQVELGMKSRDVGVIQGRRRRLTALTIAIQKSLADGIDDALAEFFGVVICDEVQLFAARTFIASVDPFRAKYRIGISADQRRKDRKEFLVHDLFGAVAAEASRSDLIDSGVIVDTEVRVIPTDFEAPWYGVPEEPQELGWDTAVPFRTDEEKSVNWDRLLVEMTEDPERNMVALGAIEQGLRQNEQVLVMSHRREHCRLIDQLLVARGYATGFLIGGEDYKSEFGRTRERFENQQIRVAVGTFQAIGYGIDLPKAGVVVCITPIAANRQFFNQVRGRVCRSAKGKTDSWMYYLWDRRVYGITHVQNLVRWNRGRVVVWDHGRWVDAKVYIRALRVEAHATETRV